MGSQVCNFIWLGICFEPAASGASDPIFGIADFLATVAIFVVAYGLSEPRYKFRAAASTLADTHLLFGATLVSGVILLVSSVWFSLELPIPVKLNNPLIFQATIAGLLIAVLAFWMFRTFVKPPRFSRRNAIPFSRQVYFSITDGDEAKLLAAAHEIGRSAEILVREASRLDVRRNLIKGGFEDYRPETSQIAYDILGLLGDRRFCRIVAQKSPWVAAEIFRTAAEDGIDVRPLVPFARNVSDEFFLDENSAIHHEGDGYYSGLIGHLKPITTAFFGNSDLIERLARHNGSPLELMWLSHGLWKIASWETYSRVALLYLRDSLKKGQGAYVNFGLSQIFSGYEHICNDIHRVDEMTDRDYYQSLEFQKFQNAIDFIRDIIALLDKNKVFGARQPEMRHDRPDMDNIYNQLAKLALELMGGAGSVLTSDFRGWTVQHNTLWVNLMREYEESPARAVFRARLQRLIWTEISQMERMPNYGGARILAVCLNTMGFRLDIKVHKPVATRALKRMVLTWVRTNFLTLHREYPDVARACIGGTITFDQENGRLVKTYRGSLGKEPAREFLELEGFKAEN